MGVVRDWDRNSLPFEMRLLEVYLENPQVNNRAIRDLCWRFYNSNGVVRNVVDYMCALPTLDKIVFTKNKKRTKDKDSGNMVEARPDNFSSNRQKFLQVLDKIKDKEIIRDSILKNCNDGVSFYYFVTEQTGLNEKFIDPLVVATLTEINKSKTPESKAPNCSLLPLPTNYCKIVGFWNNSYVIAFDLFYFNHFISAGLKRKLAQYPKEIRDAWKNYNMSTGANRWLVLDSKKTVVTKIGSKRESCWGLPISAAAISDILYYDYLVDTKRNALDSVNNKVVYQEFPQGKENGTSSLTKDQQADQHNKIKGALNSRAPGQWGMSFFSVAPGTKLNVMNTDVGVLNTGAEDDLLERTAADMGFGAPLLSGVSSGNYALLKLNLELVSAQVLSWIAQFQTELNKVINYNIIQNPSCVMEVDYLPMTYVNRTEMVTRMKELYTLGRGSWQAWVSSTGLNFESFLAMLDDEVERGLEHKYPIHVTSFTVADRDPPDDMERDVVGGRLTNIDSLNENTLASRNNDGNNSPKANI